MYLVIRPNIPKNEDVWGGGIVEGSQALLIIYMTREKNSVIFSVRQNFFVSSGRLTTNI